MKNTLEKMKRSLKKNKYYKYIIGIIIIIIIIVLILITVIYLNKNMIIFNKNGNNKNSQEIINNILNIRSYKIMSDVEIVGNKIINKYIIKNEYYRPNKTIKEVLEPRNISGVRIVRKGDIVTIEKTKMDLIKIYENYEYLSDKILDLSYFIEEYKVNVKKHIESNSEIILENRINENGYKKFLKLYINKQSGLPQKMTINDTSKNQTINILYREVELSYD